jgi:hypothetical protein
MSATLGRLRIGEVHTLLRKDYPDIELSKIRYYEDKGLVLARRAVRQGLPPLLRPRRRLPARGHPPGPGGVRAAARVRVCA